MNSQAFITDGVNQLTILNDRFAHLSDSLMKLVLPDGAAAGCFRAGFSVLPVGTCILRHSPVLLIPDSFDQPR